MSEEIKEKIKAYYIENDIDEILDYITNLKKEIKELEYLQNLIDKTTNYYLATLAKNGNMPIEAIEMYNLLEENKR